MTKIKICGLVSENDIEAANRLRPDYVGFVFAKSRRRLTLEKAAALNKLLDKSIGSVGIFVDERPDLVARMVRECGLAVVQLHGEEDGSYVESLRFLLPENCEIWKAARVRSPEDIALAAATGADRLLLDAYSPYGRGGSGETFDWSLIGGYADVPFFLAGGLTPENAGAAVRQVRPYGLDVSSGVETDGKKDDRKMERFVKAVRGASTQMER